MNHYKIKILFFVLMFWSYFFKAQSQCGYELVNICYNKLGYNSVFIEKTSEEPISTDKSAKNGSIKIIRVFPIQNSEKTKDESMTRVISYNVVFSRNTKYGITTCNDETKPGKVVASLYQNDELISTTYDVNTKEYTSNIKYEAEESGLFSLEFMFKNGEKGCAVGVLYSIN